ncbi:MAG: hypothetical protein JW953_17235 [Anaerolineae bacterium]|nr:hypothetical protein [Anaerolineae bacterium]
MVKYWQPAIQKNSDVAMERAARRYLNQHPEMNILVPILLERGDPNGRKFALELATVAETPELLDALHRFALGQHGPDDLRHRALQTVFQAGLLPAGPVKMWLRGEWQEIVTLGFEIYDEPVEDKDHSPQVLDWMQQAVDALYNRQSHQAEELLQRALELEPDAPDNASTLPNLLRLVWPIFNWPWPKICPPALNPGWMCGPRLTQITLTWLTGAGASDPTNPALKFQISENAWVFEEITNQV